MLSARELLWTVGEYDIVGIIDAPDDEMLMALLLQLGSRGNFPTKTLKVFNAQEVKGIIERAV